TCGEVGYIIIIGDTVCDKIKYNAHGRRLVFSLSLNRWEVLLMEYLTILVVILVLIDLIHNDSNKKN
ncbi:MAG: hypothetical protein PUB37_00755, partial [Firmicutes bacterium]|nr:hypothetical protein [Bacillota bacterium]